MPDPIELQDVFLGTMSGAAIVLLGAYATINIAIIYPAMQRSSKVLPAAEGMQNAHA